MAHSNGPLSQSEAEKALAAIPRLDHSKIPGMDNGAMRGMRMPEFPKDANQVPLFPQDAFGDGQGKRTNRRRMSCPQTGSGFCVEPTEPDLIYGHKRKS
jgi:hypothetical protein